jgi:uncharacterized protein GlcG (DUF336 family)
MQVKKENSLLGKPALKWTVSALTVALMAAGLVNCGGGGGSSGSGSSLPPGIGLVESAASIDPVTNTARASDYFLTEAEVRTIINQGRQAAIAQGVQGTFAVVDRVGNVLAVYTTDGTDPSGTVAITSNRGVRSGLEDFDTATPTADNAPVPRSFFAIAKAITGAYLSSSGNAFSTRTASLIVQENFYPGETGQPAGPLFGVQFSQLPCGDLVRDIGQSATAGPKRSPLGLGADPGGFPLYKNGVVVGGIGFITANGTYTLDPSPRDTDSDPEEIVAWTASRGFEAPAAVRGDRISGGGVFLLFTDTNGISGSVTASPISATDAGFIASPGYKASPTPTDGTPYGSAGSGYRKMTASDFGSDAALSEIAARIASRGAFVLTEGSNNRYAPRAGSQLSALDVARMLDKAYEIAFRGRAQIRFPTGSAIQVTISVVDTDGTVLGIVRTPDAPVFGTDVSLQKARSAMLMSSNLNGAQLNLIPARYRNVTSFETISQFNGTVAFSDRGLGNYARPFYTDGNNSSTTNGPFSRPFADWSPFSTGLQLDLVTNQIVANIASTTSTPANPATDRAQSCAPTAGATTLPIQNGLQIFPGGFPIYRNGTLIGGIGISGDGIDQDDMISFLGIENARRAGANLNHAPAAIRIDNFVVNGARARYVNCPFKPFNDSDQTNPCEGI